MMAASSGSYSETRMIVIERERGKLTWQTGDLWTGETVILVEISEGRAAWRELQPGLSIDEEDVFDLVGLQEGDGGDEGVQGGEGDDDNGGPGVFQLSPDDLHGEVWIRDTDPGPAQPGPEDWPVEVQPGVVGGVKDVAWPHSQLVEAASNPPGNTVF